MFARRSSGDRSVRHHPFQPIAKWCIISGCDVTILKCHITISECDFLFYSIVTNIYLKPAFSEDTGSRCERQWEGGQRGGGWAWTSSSVVRKFRLRAAKLLEIREKNVSFSACDAAKFGRRRTKINSLNEDKVRYFEENSCQRSLERFHFLVYVIVSSY